MVEEISFLLNQAAFQLVVLNSLSLWSRIRGEVA
jgi:hypothetical protein